MSPDTWTEGVPATFRCLREEEREKRVKALIEEARTEWREALDALYDYDQHGGSH